MSAPSADEHERTLTFAKVALGQMRSLRHSVEPRNYEVWYVYATGYNQPLNEAINGILARNGAVTEADMENLHASFLCSHRLSDRLDKVGGQVLGEIEQVMAMIEAAAGSASTYSESLADVSAQLGAPMDREALRSIVEGLVATAKDMEADNKTLEARLTASREEISELQQSLDTARHESLTDPLTTLSNRKYFDQSLARAVQDAVSKHEPLSLMMIDIDHFKSFNDSYGHLTGDQVLRLVAMSLKHNVKGQDIAARYGGEEFAIVLPNTVLRSATSVADHIRRTVMTKQLMKRSTHEPLGRISVSVGVAMLQPGDTASTLIGRADACLYAAKRAGRNCVICETDPQYAQSTDAQVA